MFEEEAQEKIGFCIYMNMPESPQEFIKRHKESVEKQPFRTWPDIGRKGKHVWKIESETFMPQSGLKEKLLMVQRLRHMKETGKIAYKRKKIGRVEYRIGYYMLALIGKRKGKWTWGESAPLIPDADLFKLIELAKREGTII